MTYEHIIVETDGPLTIITINRPEARNALHRPAQIELAAAFDAFRDAPEQWVAILTGAGDQAFCAGHDLKQQASGGGLGSTPAGFGGLAERRDLDKPVIAAVNGGAFGGGFETVLACDIVVAARHTRFALPEPRVGLAALGGGMQRLPREIGLKRAMGMMLTGRAVTADEAFQLGFVNEVVDDDVVGAARRWANDILLCSPLSVQTTKRIVLDDYGRDPVTAIGERRHGDLARRLLSSPDAVEGPLAFSEKRRPKWRPLSG